MSQTPEELSRKIKEAKENQAGSENSLTGASKAQNMTGAGRALRASTDLVAALVVGGLLGYGIDRWLSTKPWGMILFFFLGFAAGMLNIYRSETGKTYDIGFKENDKEK